MKIIKEDLDNLERVENRQTVQGIMMKDAEEQSKKSEDNFKEVAGNPEDLKKKKPFISGEKQPKPKDVEIPKPELEESLFEEAESSVAIYKDSYTKLMYVRKELKQNVSSLSLSQLSGLAVLATDILNLIGGGLETNMNSESMDEELDVDVFTPEEARAYWEKEHSNDPVLSEYDSFNDWYEDSVANGYIKESCQSKLNEAGGMKKDGILYSTDGEPLTFWDKIYAELDGNLHPQENDYVKLSELPVKSRNDKYQEISVTGDGNIRVFAPTKDKLEHAIKVANHYKLEYDAGTSVGYTDPNKAFYCTIKIPEEKQDEYVTYDARKIG